MKALQFKLLFLTASSLVIYGCNPVGERKLKVGLNNTDSDTAATTEIIRSEAVNGNSYLSKSEAAVKRYKSIDNIAKIISRTLNVNVEEKEWSIQAKKNTGTLSYFSTNAVTTTSRAIDSVSLAWFKEVRQYAGRKCRVFVNREAANVKPDNILIKTKNSPTADTLNDLTLRTLRLDGVDDRIHKITSHYADIMKSQSEKQTAASGTDEFLDGIKNAYRMYCIAVLTDPLVIFY